jgi:1-acyl-sn-glycerol-3-phosphate acyltransferase
VIRHARHRVRRRKGYLKLDLSKRVPIVPVVAIGGQETALFLIRGRRLAKALGLDTAFRLKVLPVQIAPPLGITVIDMPIRIPLPAQLTIQVLPPVDLEERFGSDADLGWSAHALMASTPCSFATQPSST